MYTHFVIHLSFLFRDEIGINFEFLKVTKALSPSDNRLKKTLWTWLLTTNLMQAGLEDFTVYFTAVDDISVNTKMGKKKTYIGCNLHMWRKFLISRH